jgi:hypothetical protein
MHLMQGQSIDPRRRSAYGNYDGGARAGRRLEANAERANSTIGARSRFLRYTVATGSRA